MSHLRILILCYPAVSSNRKDEHFKIVMFFAQGPLIFNLFAEFSLISRAGTLGSNRYSIAQADAHKQLRSELRFTADPIQP